MCTVALRWSPAARWPLLLAAVRDEFTDRSWDPPAAHWPAIAPGATGGRDHTAGGTWLAVTRNPPAVAALLNGVPLTRPAAAPRPSRGGLPLAILTDEQARAGAPAQPPALADVANYDSFHLLLAVPDRVQVWSWDGTRLRHRELGPGDHIIVNLGIDTDSDPLVPHFAPLLAKLPSTVDVQRQAATGEAWPGWVDFLTGDGLPPDDPRALIVRRQFAGREYGSTSASLVALAADDVRFDFTATPQQPTWMAILVP